MQSHFSQNINKSKLLTVQGPDSRPDSLNSTASTSTSLSTSTTGTSGPSPILNDPRYSNPNNFSPYQHSSANSSFDAIPQYGTGSLHPHLSNQYHHNEAPTYSYNTTIKPSSTSHKFIPNHSLFVGDLSYFCDEQSLRSFFSPYGPVVAVSINRDRVTHRSLLYGFLELPSEDHRNAAKLELDSMEFMGRRIRYENQPSSFQFPLY